MEKIELAIRKNPKRIVFDVSESDHTEIKSIATRNHVTMRNWLINVIALAIEKDHLEHQEH